MGDPVRTVSGSGGQVSGVSYPVSDVRIHPHMKTRTPDMGCGRNKRPGAIGMDRVKLPEVDLVHDLNRIPYPIKDNIFDEVYATHVIEHMDSVLAVMEEIYRICRPHARVTLITPHYTDSSRQIGWEFKIPNSKFQTNSNFES